MTVSKIEWGLLPPRLLLHLQQPPGEMHFSCWEECVVQVHISPSPPSCLSGFTPQDSGCICININVALLHAMNVGWL